MWTRKELKEKGKIAFRKNYWNCVAAAFVLFLLLGATIAVSSGGEQRHNAVKEFLAYGINQQNLIAMLLGAGLIAKVVSVLFDMFVGNMFVVGGYRFFLKNSEEEKAGLGYLVSAYKDGKFVNVFVTMFLSDLFISLWGLLLIVPGVMKYYAYRMVPYILAEDPEISPMDALRKSEKMMNGQKWNAFVLDLSFIGWAILTALTCGLVGFFYLNPYIQATNAELYKTLKNQ